MMQMFECPRCGYKTNRRFCMKQHLERKNVCPSLNSDISLDEILRTNPQFKLKQYEKSYVCMDCQACFTSQPGLSRHSTRYCKKRIESIRETEFRELKSQHDALQEQVKMLMENRYPVNNNNGTINNNTVHNTCIQINGFRNEDIDHILQDKKFMDTVLRRREKGVLEFIKKTYFDYEMHPENVNVRVTNYKLPYIDTYDGKRWLKCGKDDVLEDMLDTSCTHIDDHYENCKDALLDEFSASLKELIHEFMERVKDREEHKVFFDALKQRIHLLVVNESKKR